MSNVAIKGIGVCLPAQERGNDFWGEDIYSQWKSGPESLAVGQQSEPSLAAVTSAIKSLEGDPFRGAKSRRVLGPGESFADLEFGAATAALAQAAIAPGQVDAVLVYSQVPDHLLTPHAPTLHRRLELRADALTLDTNNACNSFLQQLVLAEALVRGGRAERCLLVQSSGAAHVCRKEYPNSAWCGDGATAVVVGRCAEGVGLLSHSTRTDGSFDRALVTGVPGVRWYEAQQTLFAYNEDRPKAREMMLRVAQMGAEVVHDALQKAGVTPDRIDYYASHQATPWFRAVTQQVIGLSRADAIDSFAWTASLSACNIPFALHLGKTENRLRAGHLVAMYSGGSGVNYTGALMRWE